MAKRHLSREHKMKLLNGLRKHLSKNHGSKKHRRRHHKKGSSKY